jgi:hypothetical protein
LPDPRRVRVCDHVRHVDMQPCLVWGRRPTPFYGIIVH